MYLVDTSIWIDHFRNTNKKLVYLLDSNEVRIHPMIIGEIACGSIKNRAEILSAIKALSSVEIATDEDVLALIDDRKLYGKDIGWIDAHLLASALVSSVGIFTLDKPLYSAQKSLKIDSP